MTECIYRIWIASSVSLCCLITAKTTLAQTLPQATMSLNSIATSSELALNSEIIPAEGNAIALGAFPLRSPVRSFSQPLAVSSDLAKCDRQEFKQKLCSVAVRLAAKGGKGPRKR